MLTTAMQVTKASKVESIQPKVYLEVSAIKKTKISF